MGRGDWTMWHRPCIRAGVQGPDPVYLGEWTTNWGEAAAKLLSLGMATIVHGLYTMSPAVEIEKEVIYGS